MTDKVLCKFHASTGGCRNGVNCKFSHDLSNVPSQVCLYFMAGDCAFGSRCRYAHVLPDGTPLDDQQPANGTQQAQIRAQSTQASSAPSIPPSRSGWQNGKAALPAGCADAAWEDEEPISTYVSTSTAAYSAAEGSDRAPGGSIHAESSSKPGSQIAVEGPLARPRPLSKDGAMHHAKRQQEAPAGEGPCSSERTEDEQPNARQHSLSNRQYAEDTPAANSSSSPAEEWYDSEGGYVTEAGLWYDQQYGCTYEEWLADNNLDVDEQGRVHHPWDDTYLEQHDGCAEQQEGFPEDLYTYESEEHTAWQNGARTDEEEETAQEWPRVAAGDFGPSELDRQQQQQEQQQTWSPAQNQASLPASCAAAERDGGMCMLYHRSGTCSKGASCERLHGIYCKNCQHFALHPSDAQQRSEHAAACLARHKRLSSHAASRLIECSICMELVLSKADPSERKFGLLDCSHSFCLGCIRDWRSRTESGADVETAVRACPVCRQVTHYVTPSLVWPADDDEKEAIRSAYKDKLASINCRLFDYGAGTCPFSTSCMYRHAYRNGQVEERKFRKRVDADGEVGGVRDARLSDFLDASLRSQQAVRRAMRGTAAALRL